jgi:hypothetical protein
MRAILTILLLLGLAVAQEEEREITPEAGVPTEVAPGITVTITRGDPSDAPLEVAQEVYVHPGRVHEAIPYDRDTTKFNVSITSRVHADITVETSGHEDLVALGGKEYRLVPGRALGAYFTAFAPHEGSLFIYNSEGELLADVPYVITKESRFQQTVRGRVSTGVSTGFDKVHVDPVSFGVGYGIRERKSGVGGSVGLGYRTGGNLDLDVSVGGSYSW